MATSNAAQREAAPDDARRLPTSAGETAFRTLLRARWQPPWRHGRFSASPAGADTATHAHTADAHLGAAIAALTGEPEGRATALVHASDHGNRRFQADFDALAASSQRALRRRLGHVALPRAAELETALGSLGRPLMLAGMHAGPYLGGLLRLLPALPGIERLTLIRRPAACAREARVLSHLGALGVQCNVLRLAERPLLPALQALRDGEVLLTMIDVPPSFLPAEHGRQGLASTRLFGHPAWLPEGPAALAVAAGAVLLPVHCSGTPSASTVQLGPLVDAARQPGEARAAAIQRVHTGLARQFEHWLRTCPEDWLLWRHVPSFFVGPGISRAGNDARERRGAISRAPP